MRKQRELHRELTIREEEERETKQVALLAKVDAEKQAASMRAQALTIEKQTLKGLENERRTREAQLAKQRRIEREAEQREKRLLKRTQRLEAGRSYREREIKAVAQNAHIDENKFVEAKNMLEGADEAVRAKALKRLERMQEAEERLQEVQARKDEERAFIAQYNQLKLARISKRRNANERLRLAQQWAKRASPSRREKC